MSTVAEINMHCFGAVNSMERSAEGRASMPDSLRITGTQVFNIWGNSNKHTAIGKLGRTQRFLLHSGGILLRNPIHAPTGTFPEGLTTVYIFYKVSDHTRQLPCSESIKYEKHAYYSITQPYCLHMNGYVAPRTGVWIFHKKRHGPPTMPYYFKQS
jgi:hypothetical protein